MLSEPLTCQLLGGRCAQTRLDRVSKSTAHAHALAAALPLFTAAAFTRRPSSVAAVGPQRMVREIVLDWQVRSGCAAICAVTMLSSQRHRMKLACVGARLPGREEGALHAGRATVWFKVQLLAVNMR
jgi:hypothetical protein